MLKWNCAVFALLMCSSHLFADYSGRVDVDRFIDEMVAEHDFDREELRLVFADAQHHAGIIKAISRPAEKTKQWFEYRNIFLGQQRIDGGVTFWRRHAEVLEKAQSKYAVPVEIIVAIAGVETLYGKRAGSYKVLDALSTLGLDYPPRKKFFRNELKEYLLLAREEGRNPRELLGSYAGAMGYGQFMPSSFRAYAVDFDGDGRRDIWDNPEDAIGSIGNYLHRHGWKRGEPIVVLADKVDDKKFKSLANAKLKPSLSIGQWKQKGGMSVDLEDNTPAALFRMQAAEEVQYWLGLHNFYVITRYNHSRLYALAVYQLAMEIAKAHGIEKAHATEVAGK
ncbi:MAG: lytic murein transglycosylase B [Pseudomonadales bacterium]|nr:lytic murein transglycosylase B [Pseudomonadales bacterium]